MQSGEGERARPHTPRTREASDDGQSTYGSTDGRTDRKRVGFLSMLSWQRKSREILSRIKTCICSLPLNEEEEFHPRLTRSQM